MENPAASASHCLFFSLLLIILLHLTTIHKTFSSSIDTDRITLLAFKNTFTIDELARNWSSDGNSTSVCYWIGVSCGSKHQRVTALDVSGFALRGTLPPHLGNLTFLRYLNVSFNNFTGPIPAELSRLHRLRDIDLGVNSFAGEIPSWLGELPLLETLILRNNTFSGNITPSLFNNDINSSCNKLQILNLRFNSLSGNIPVEIENCFSLQIVKLDFNNLTGSVPYAIFNLPSITEIWITSNGLSGGLPIDLCNHHLSNLTTLALSKNQLEGRIPPNIWKCRELEVLLLSTNSFSGEIPSEIGSLSMLKELYLGDNIFEGTIPNQIGNLSSLESLELSNNSFTGPISQIWNCTSLRMLYLARNNLTGRLPLEWSLFNLEVLHLNFNNFSGEIPSSITNASKLTVLQLNSNSFSGFMPNFGSLRLLRRLQIWDNNLRGVTYPNEELEFLSSLTNCRFLEAVDVSINPLNGVLPASIGNLSKYLYAFSVDHCNITSVIPSSIGNLTGLLGLSMIYNQFTGSIPPTIGKSKQLQGLYLNGNRLQGYIPHNLCRLNNIFNLNLGDNVLTGPIPECFGEMDSIGNIDLGLNHLNSTIPSNFWNLEDLLFVNLSSNNFSGKLSSQISSLKVVYGLDFSHNQFSGDIPASIESCQSLEILYLSNNKFEGSIPPSLGNTRGLKALDLSNNKLTGFIPNSFQGLRFLLYIDVSYNNLEGEIPIGGPFVNFTAQSFSNNYALCGPIQFQVPPCPKNNRTSRRKEVLRLIKFTLPPLVLVCSLATIIILVLLWRQKRKLKRVQAPADVTLDATWRRVSYIELVRGTNFFSTETNLLGRGSFGSVFKATLPGDIVVAVKVFDLQSERATQSFDTECEILSTIRHRNLVQILGCCSNMEFKALILEHMSNGSLENWLHCENRCLNLTQRLQIAIEVGLALEYLHHGHTFQIVHCDIKPSNVLLDEDMVAHLADFGISKLFEDGETMVHTKTLATLGYAAPEYGSEGKVSSKGDVYSYGILLLEMFTTKKPTDDMFSGEMSLREWVHRALQENAVTEVISPDLLLSTEDDQSLTEECISSVFNLAMKCLAVSPDERINMIETMRALQRIKDKVKTTTARRRRYA